MIYDQRTAELCRRHVAAGTGHERRFRNYRPTIATLGKRSSSGWTLWRPESARDAGCEFPHGPTAQISQFNRDAKAGKDSQFKRGCIRMMGLA